MSHRNAFQTTTAAEFRKIAAAAQAAGRLPEFIEAMTTRLMQYQAMLEMHETARDIQKTRETKKKIANLETKLELARQIAQKGSYE